MSISTIFHPADFSKGDEKAFYHSLRIALACKGALSLLHVGSPMEKVEWNDFPRVSSTLYHWGFNFDTLEKGSDKQSQIKIQKIRKSGKEPKEILKYLKTHPADLVVLATHQRSAFDRLLHKAIAEPIARESGKMTLFVPRRVNGFISSKDGSVSLKNILIPIDHKPHPQRAFDAVLELIKLLGCPKAFLTFLYINGKEEDIPSIHFPSQSALNFEFIMEKGTVTQTILKMADTIKADLIVMATQGHKGFLDALRGSTTEQVLRKANCPLFAIPEYQK